MDRTHRLPITRQAQLLGLSRSSVYYRAVPVSEWDLSTMRRIDELHLELPFCGARMLRDLLVLEGWRIGRKHVTTLMRRMGIEAIGVPLGEPMALARHRSVQTAMRYFQSGAVQQTRAANLLERQPKR